MKQPGTPFPTTAYFGPEYFCDREEELASLKRNLKGGNSTTLVALRRLGKTALIKHLFFHLGSRYTKIYLDILPTESLGDLLNQFTSSIAEAIPENSSAGKKIWTFIRSLRPTVTYDALQGTSVFSINATQDQSRQSIQDLLILLENQAKPAVIAIDEFQQILSYPEQQTDAWLRSIIQKLTHVTFIFAGNQQHLMQELFANPQRPFFRSTQFLKIDKLSHGAYQEFIIQKFSANRKSITPELVDEMLNWADHHTYYVQLLCNRTFLASGKRVDSNCWKEEARRILKEQEFVFFGYREMLTIPQWSLLKALAKDGYVPHPTSADFISRHALGNPATVLRSLKSLQKMELVYREADTEGRSYYGIYDVLFRRWIA